MSIEIKFTGEMQRIEKRPDDVWIIHCDQPIGAELAVRIREHVKHVIGDARVLILDSHLRLTVGREEIAH